MKMEDWEEWETMQHRGTRHPERKNRVEKWGIEENGRPCCLSALYYGRRPDLISLGCIHLSVPLSCAWGVLFDGPYNAADVVNVLKTSVRKGDTEKDVEWRSVMHWASTG